jgi:hypothetical protein
MSSIGVVLDACVLFPGVLRDTLLHAAKADIYSLHLTEDILEEARRNLVIGVLNLITYLFIRYQHNISLE